MTDVVALIPARGGSKRVPGKNVKLLGGQPLIVWSIEAAVESGIFRGVYVCTDDVSIGCVASEANAQVIMRELSADDESDIVWLRRALSHVHADAFALLRPTSPFRTAETIRRAWQAFLDGQPADSLRAIVPVSQHPGKMWVIRNGRLLPLLPFEGQQAPWHSSPTQTLPAVYAQTAGLEIAWVHTVTDSGTIAGASIIPFALSGREAIDVNTSDDWDRAEAIIVGRRRE